MSAEIHHFPVQGSGAYEQSNTADVYDGIDAQNVTYEARQLSVITHTELDYLHRTFDLVTYSPSDGLRTCADMQGNAINYPELLLVHGVASDARFFDPLFQKMNKLGIRCSAISLPRQHDVFPDGDSLLDWQTHAVVTAYDYIKTERPSTHIILGGHSRGAIVATKAKRQTYAEHGSGVDEGLLLLAPAGLDTYDTKSIGHAALNLLPLAFNSLRHSDSTHLFGMYALMISQVVSANPSQTAIEILQALRMNVADDITKELASVSVFIPAAEQDEFIDHQKIITIAELAPNSNISLATLPTNHLLGSKETQSIASLSDPRCLSGQILGWMQSQTEGYRPLAVHAATGQISRLS